MIVAIFYLCISWFCVDLFLLIVHIELNFMMKLGIKLIQSTVPRNLSISARAMECG